VATDKTEEKQTNQNKTILIVDDELEIHTSMEIL